MPGASVNEGYCMKCKGKREIKDAKEITTKNGKRALDGKCVKCGTRMFRILGKGEKRGKGETPEEFTEPTFVEGSGEAIEGGHKRRSRKHSGGSRKRRSNSRSKSGGRRRSRSSVSKSKSKSKSTSKRSRGSRRRSRK